MPHTCRLGLCAELHYQGSAIQTCIHWMSCFSPGAGPPPKSTFSINSIRFAHFHQPQYSLVLYCLVLWWLVLLCDVVFFCVVEVFIFAVWCCVHLWCFMQYLILVYTSFAMALFMFLLRSYLACSHKYPVLAFAFVHGWGECPTMRLWLWLIHERRNSIY